MKSGQLDEPERLYKLAGTDDPYHTEDIAGLDRVHISQMTRANYLDDRALIAAGETDDFPVHQALADH
jgi:hypothetical protein